MKFRKRLSTIALAVPLALFGTLALSAGPAAAGYGPPTTGHHVTYYDCKGPYNYNWKTVYDCWADWDWYAELFWNKVDKYELVPATYWA